MHISFATLSRLTSLWTLPPKARRCPGLTVLIHVVLLAGVTMGSAPIAAASPLPPWPGTLRAIVDPHAADTLLAPRPNDNQPLFIRDDGTLVFTDLRRAFQTLRDSAEAGAAYGSYELAITPGLYRLDRPLFWSGERHGPHRIQFIMRATGPPESVVISGARVVRNPARLLDQPAANAPLLSSSMEGVPFTWTTVDSTTHLYRLDGFYDWGVLDISGYKARYQKWMNNVDRPELLRRREMVLVDGSLLTQQLGRDELHPGCFWIDGGARDGAGPDEPFIRLDGHSQATDPASAPHLWLQLDRPLAAVDSIEFPVAPALLHVRDLDRVVLHGIRFQHANPFHASSTVTLAGVPSVRVEACAFLEGNWRGFKLEGVPRPVDWDRPDSMEVIGCRAVGNGAYGMSASFVARLRLEGCETSWNNWRGFAAGTEGWAVGGMKLFRVRNVSVLGHVASYNQATGLWFDTSARGVRIEGGHFEGNSRDGLFLEANPGPIRVEACSFVDNGREGLRINSCDSLTVTGNRFVHNGAAAIGLADLGRVSPEWDGNEEEGVRLEGLGCRVMGNVFRNDPVFRTTRWVSDREERRWLHATEIRGNDCGGLDPDGPLCR